MTAAANRPYRPRADGAATGPGPGPARPTAVSGRRVAGCSWTTVPEDLLTGSLPLPPRAGDPGRAERHGCRRPDATPLSAWPPAAVPSPRISAVTAPQIRGSVIRRR